MVDSGQLDLIRRTTFTSRRHPGVPVEVLERSDLLSRLGSALFATPERPSFHVMHLVRHGHGMHTVDFDGIPAVAGRLIWVRPGQVQLWDARGDFEATLVLSEATAAIPGWASGQASYRDLGESSLNTANALIEALRREQERFADDEPSIRLLNHLFGGLVALFDRAAAPASMREAPPAYLAFRDALEADVGATHNVRDYARRLGYSERTLSRACRRVTGLTAKAVLDERIALEAKRLLAHTDRPAADIAAELGFAEPTNFRKFFVRLASTTPGAFRAALRVGTG